MDRKTGIAGHGQGHELQDTDTEMDHRTWIRTWIEGHGHGHGYRHGYGHGHGHGYRHGFGHGSGHGHEHEHGLEPEQGLDSRRNNPLGKSVNLLIHFKK